MKRPTQSTIAEAQRWTNEHLGWGPRELLTKKGSAELGPVEIDGHVWVYTRRGLCETVAAALERGELPPPSMCKLAAEILREAAKKQRGHLAYRNGKIIFLLAKLKNRNLPLFPNHGHEAWDQKRQVALRRQRLQRGKPYGCDIVIEAFEKVGIRLTMATVEAVWKQRPNLNRP